MTLTVKQIKLLLNFLLMRIKYLGKVFWNVIKFGTIVIFLSLFVASLLSCYFESDLLSWFPAVGTILAIITGFTVTVLQLTDQQERIKRKSQQACNLTYLSIKYVHDRLNNAQSTPSERIRNLQRYKTKQVIEDIQKISYTDLFESAHNHAEVWDCFYEIRTRLVAINKKIDIIWDQRDQKDQCQNNIFKSSNSNMMEAICKWNDLVKILQSSDFDIIFFRTECHPNERICDNKSETVHEN